MWSRSVLIIKLGFILFHWICIKNFFADRIKIDWLSQARIKTDICDQDTITIKIS